MKAIAWAVVWHVTALLVLSASSAGCATFGAGAKSCEERLTPELVQKAAVALQGQDYETRIEVDLANVAACLVQAAIAAAVDQARHTKAAGTVDQAAIVRHGESWQRTHGGQAGGPVSGIQPTWPGSTSRRYAERAGRGPRRAASRPPGTPPSPTRALSVVLRARRGSRPTSRRLGSGSALAPRLQVA